MPEFRSLTSLPAVHAAIVKGALEAEGIDVILDGSGIGNIYALEMGTWATHLMVPVEQMDRARAVLAEFDASEEADRAFEAGGDGAGGDGVGGDER